MNELLLLLYYFYYYNHYDCLILVVASSSSFVCFVFFVVLLYYIICCRLSVEMNNRWVRRKDAAVVPIATLRGTEWTPVRTWFRRKISYIYDHTPPGTAKQDHGIADL